MKLQQLNHNQQRFLSMTRLRAAISKNVDRYSRILQPKFWLPLVVSLGLAGEIILLESTIVPQAAHAYTATVDIEVEPRVNESYETLLRRAESIVRAAAQRSFDQDILVTEVSITILAQREGATVPLMTMQVSRPQWRSRPDPKYWANYFRSAQTFLQFDQPGGTPTPQPASTPTPAPTAPPAIDPLSTPTPTGVPQPIRLPGRGSQPYQVPEYSPSGQPTQVPRYTPGGAPLPTPSPQPTTPSNAPTNTEETLPDREIEVPNIPRQRG
jgi:hypothetical protein